MIGAARKAVAALRAYVEADETSHDLEDQMADALERLLRAASKQDWDVAMVYDAYITWLEEN